MPRLSQSQNPMEWREAVRLGQGDGNKTRDGGEKGNAKEGGLDRGL